MESACTHSCYWSIATLVISNVRNGDMATSRCQCQLKIVINDRLSATDHVNAVLSSCSGLLDALRILHSHGMPTSSLHDVFRATIVAKIFYGSPAWSGLCSAADRSRLNAFLRRCKRYNYCLMTFQLLKICSLTLTIHYLNSLSITQRTSYTPSFILPAKSEQPYNLRERLHNYSLVAKTSELNERDYITHILYKDNY